MERWGEWGGGLSGEFTVGLKSEKQCDLVLGRGGVLRRESERIG